MSQIIFTLTQAGINATTQSSGVKAVISHIGFGAGDYVPTGTETTLSAQQDFIAITSGIDNGDQITIEAILSGSQNYSIKEIGIFLEDGTLFAIYSHPTNTIAYKSAGTDFQFVYTLTLSGVNTDNVTLNVSAFGEATLQSHIQNIANPHNITPSQIGAASQTDLDTTNTQLTDLINNPSATRTETVLFTSTGGAKSGSIANWNTYNYLEFLLTGNYELFSIKTEHIEVGTARNFISTLSGHFHSSSRITIGSDNTFNLSDGYSQNYITGQNYDNTAGVHSISKIIGVNHG